MLTASSPTSPPEKITVNRILRCAKSSMFRRILRSLQGESLFLLAMASICCNSKRFAVRWPVCRRPHGLSGLEEGRFLLMVIVARPSWRIIISRVSGPHYLMQYIFLLDHMRSLFPIIDLLFIGLGWH